MAIDHDDLMGLFSAQNREQIRTRLRLLPLTVGEPLMACRVAGACDHAELAAQQEIGRSDSTARLPSARSSCVA